MTSTTPIYRGDLGPLQFATAVLLGTLGSAALSYLHVPGWVSVTFAVGIMFILALLRYWATSRLKDAESLDAFAEDIYLLGYLLTLAALLGLAPRLMSDETNLFQIAGLKLVTTVVGLGLMMVFRQLARRWADEKKGEQVDAFSRQQQLFSEAVGRLNEGADQLTAKLQDVIRSFDPGSLAPIADWSARASGAFGSATSAIATIPAAVDNCVRGLLCLGDDLQRTKTAAAELAGILTAGTAQAANVLTAEFIQASQAAGRLGAQVSGLQPAGEGARAALQNLESQATAGAAKLGEVVSSLHSTDQELAKMGRTLKRLLELHSDQPELPLNRLITALDANTTGAANSATKLETIQGGLAAVATASQEVVQRMERHIEKPLLEHRETLDRTQQTMAAVADQFEGAKAQLETTATELRPDPAASEKLIAGLDSLRQEMGETNRQIQTLVKRLDAAAAPDGGAGFFRRFMGGGPANRP